MNDDDFAALVLKRLDGSISQEEDVLLRVELEREEGRRRMAVSLGRVHGGLLETLSADRERDALSRRGRRGAALAVAAALLLAVGIGVITLRHDEPPVRPARSWSFDGLPAGETPPGFEVFASSRTSAGRWVVRPGGLLGQTDDRPAERFAGAVAVEPSYRHVRVSARVRLVSGYQRAGIVWGWRDPDHYYVAAINPIERNLRVDRVEGGRRVELADRNLEILTARCSSSSS